MPGLHNRAGMTCLFALGGAKSRDPARYSMRKPCFKVLALVMVVIYGAPSRAMDATLNYPSRPIRLIVTNTPDEFRRLVQNELNKYGEVGKTVGLKAD